MDQLIEKLANFRERLLDLSAKNPLINSKFGIRTTSQIRIIDELPDHLYHKLSDGKKMVLEPLPPMETEPRDELRQSFIQALEVETTQDKKYIEEIENIDRLEDFEDLNQEREAALRRLKDRLRRKLNMPPRTSEPKLLAEHARNCGINPSWELPIVAPGGDIKKKWTDSKIQTLLLTDDLKRQERSIEKFYQRDLKESGVNTLYFAFGFLEWKESENSERTLRSPLLLLQVILSEERKKKTSIMDAGDLLIINMTLSEKLNRDFRLSLPEFEQKPDDENEPSIEDYLEKVQKEVAEPKGWRVRRWASFGIYKNTNLPIYEDIKKIEKSEISEILKTILGGGNKPSFQPLPEYEIESEEVQTEAPVLVRSADASQHSAVVDVLKGKNMVINGPPGTGKSQTITNIISSLMYQGKSVLFTAQKQAALDIVRNNLTECNLGDYILEVFSTKANKQHIAKSLQERIDLPNIVEESNLLEKTIQRAFRTKKELNQYAKFINTPYGSGTLTRHQILWDIPDLKLESEMPQTLRDFSVPEPEKIDTSSLDTAITELSYLRKTYLDIFNDTSLAENRITTIKKHYSNVYTIKQDLHPKLNALYKDLLELKEKKASILNHNNSLGDLSQKDLIDHTSRFNKIATFLKKRSEKKWLRIIVSSATNLEISKWIQGQRFLDKEQQEYQETLKNIESKFHLDDKGFDLYDIRDAAKELKTTNIFSFFSSQWHKSKVLFKDLYKSDNKKLTSADKGNELLKLHLFLTTQKSKQEKLKQKQTQLDTLKDQIIAKDHLLNDFDDLCKNDTSEEILDALSKCSTLPDSFRNGWINDPSSVEEYTQLAHKEGSLVEACCLNLREMEVDVLAAFDKKMEDLDLNSLHAYYKEITNNPISLEKYMKWLQAEKNIRDSTLNEFYKTFLYSGLTFDLISVCYKWIVRHAQARDIYDNHSEFLSRYSGGYIEQLRQQLQDDDKRIGKLWEKNLAAKIFDRKNVAPEGKNAVKVADKTESNLVRHLITKPKSRLSVRHFFHKAHASILALKPCTLMSPMSVAQALPLKETYDVLVIDEASQMKPEHALGSIARAKQVVIVGDKNQLPPFTFGGSGYEDDPDADDESILDMAETVFHPPRLLNRHYRSRHQDLIRFSNQEFYEGKLEVPHTANPEEKNRGIEYRYISDGYYSHRTNLKEAEAIITEVLRFMKERKNESLGVVTMNLLQRDLLQTLFDQKSQKNSGALDYLSRWKNKDQGINEFFIKNLETVQGDERDVMMVGTLYGPSKETEQVLQRFTAFTKQDGWRRLNVVITRAKHQLFLFTCLKPQQIRDAQIKSRGVSVFQKYLGYAETKVLPPGKANIEEVDNYFQQWAIDKINSFPGFSADHEIGVEKFRIDIGVKHEDFPGYVIGVETDGKTYHSSKSARDRDYLRQKILEGYGWTFHRIWSTDWIEDPVGTKEKLKIALDNRIAYLKEQQRIKLPEKIEKIYVDEELINNEYDTPNDDKQFTSQVYVEADIEEVIESDPGLFYDTEYLSRLQQGIQYIIETEGPISHELLVKRVRLAHGWAKAGNPIKAQINKALPKNRCTTQSGVETFYWPNNCDPETYRTGRKPQESQLIREEHRSVTQVCFEEIRAIAEIIQGDRFNLPKSEIAKDIVKFLGYFKCTARMRKYIFEALDNDKNKSPSQSSQ